MRRLLLPLVLVLSPACSTPVLESPAEPALEASGNCPALAGFEVHAATPTPALTWSAAHALTRFFGEHQSPFHVDAALVAAMRSGVGVPDSREAWMGYANQVNGCWVGPWPMPNVSLPMTTDIAWTRPGQPIALGSAEAVLVDLRAIPEGPTLTAYLDELARAVLDAEVTPLEAEVRVHHGMFDEAYAPHILSTSNIHNDAMERRPLRALPAGAARHRALGLVVGPHIAPSAARFALTLRAAQRAILLGAPIDTRVAETSTAVAGDGALAVRTMRLFAGAEVLPDQVMPDAAGTSYAELEDALRAHTAIAPLSGDATRAPLQAFPDASDAESHATDESARVADLIIMHGALRRFFPYWDVVEDTLDVRLAASLALPRRDADDVLYLHRSISHFLVASHDSHGFVIDYLRRRTATPGVVVMPYLLDATEAEEPIVRASSSTLFARGDVLVALDGRPVAELSEAFLDLTPASASSRVRNGLHAFDALRSGALLRVRAPSGTERDVTVPAVVNEAPPPLLTRRVQTLESLGHPDVVYANVDGDAFGPAELSTLRELLLRARALILDMRGYPGRSTWQLTAELMPDGSPGVRMETHEVWVDGTARVSLPQVWEAWPGAFGGPIAMLVGPSTQSAAEHLALTLQAAHRVHLIGRPTAGANGDITGLALPGDFGFTFTGLRVLQRDGSAFHGVGCIPDETLAPTQAALAASADPELDRALEYLAE